MLCRKRKRSLLTEESFPFEQCCICDSFDFKIAQKSVVRFLSCSKCGTLVDPKMNWFVMLWHHFLDSHWRLLDSSLSTSAEVKDDTGSDLENDIASAIDDAIVVSNSRRTSRMRRALYETRRDDIRPPLRELSVPQMRGARVYCVANARGASPDSEHGKPLQ